MKEDIIKLLKQHDFRLNSQKPNEYIYNKMSDIRAIVTDRKLFIITRNPKSGKYDTANQSTYDNLDDIKRMLERSFKN